MCKKAFVYKPLLYFLALLLLFLVASNAENADSWFERGCALRAQGNYSEAINAFSEAIRLNSNYIDRYELNSVDDPVRSYFDQSRRSAFLEPYDKAIEQDPENLTAWFSKGRALFEKWEFVDAAEVYDEASKKCRPDAVSWIKEGRYLSSMGGRSGYEEAIKCFDRAIEIYNEYPNNATVWNNKGVALLFQAKADLNSYLENPSHADYRRAKYEGALECFEKALQMDPACPATWRNEGYALWCLNNGHETIEYYETVLGCFDKANNELEDRKDGCIGMDKDSIAIAEDSIHLSLLELKYR
jgi:tetratricopeptide (TPR) repeat protein